MSRKRLNFVHFCHFSAHFRLQWEYDINLTIWVHYLVIQVNLKNTEICEKWAHLTIFGPNFWNFNITTNESHIQTLGRQVLFQIVIKNDSFFHFLLLHGLILSSIPELKRVIFLSRTKLWWFCKKCWVGLRCRPNLYFDSRFPLSPFMGLSRQKFSISPILVYVIALSFSFPKWGCTLVN